MPPPVPPTADFERLGQFYLGREYDLEGRARKDGLLLYDARDLVTHAVCVGMTGSGKTGLCIGLLEEAAIDGVPAIIIDPKGDLSNLLLTFPGLQPADFRPWINEDDARRKGLSPDDFAAEQARRWAGGLAEWGQDGARIARLKSAADFAVYTPGSSAGLPVSVLKSFDPPPAEIMEDGELLRERISGTATSLLGLINVQADPLQSREHILISGILSHAWGKGEALDLPTLIRWVQTPPFTQLGVMELESVFPAKERFGLAMALNNLVASPGYAAWTTGEPLDIGAMLYTRDGKARHAIFSIAHLSDAERMFFVSLLLNQTLAWVRTQSGTTSLRAILYMDEIAGYVPPTANPPSKWPLLTLMKQGRAFGMGVVLATQNPVDLDYKGLSNAGTWFIGRLQTERDKMRVLDGLEGAMAGGRSGAGFDRAAADRALSSLQPRVFLMNNVHDDRPTIFETRWCMSYLRGPLTREQIKVLTRSRAVEAREPAAQPSSLGGPPMSGEPLAAPAARAASPARPVLPPDVPQYFLPVRHAGAVRYQPMLLAVGSVYYNDVKSGVDTDVPASYLVPMHDAVVPVDWDHAIETALSDREVRRDPEPAVGTFGSLPAAASRAKSYDDWKRSFADVLFREHKLELRRSAALKLTSAPGEDERSFRLRMAQAAREARDDAVERLRAKYGPKMNTLQDRLRRAQQAVQKQQEQASAARMNTGMSIGSAIFGAILGRKTVSASTISRASSAARAGSRARQEAADVERATESADAVARQIGELQTQFEREVQQVTAELDAASADLQTVTLKPKKTNITVRAVLLAWAPVRGDGGAAW